MRSATAFTLNWVSRFGCPQIITCDRGSQFTSRVGGELCNFLGCKLMHTTSYHPIANELIERQHRTLKAALKAQQNPYDWYHNLGFVLLGLRASPNVDTGISSAELRLGTTLRLPGHFFEPSTEQAHTRYASRLKAFMDSVRAQPTRHHAKPKSHFNKFLTTCTHVFVCNDNARSSFDRPYTGPYSVVSKAPKYFTVDFGKRIDVINVDRLKALHLLDHLEPPNEFDDDGFVNLTPGSSSWGQAQNSNPINHFPVADDAQK